MSCCGNYGRYRYPRCGFMRGGMRPWDNEAENFEGKKFYDNDRDDFRRSFYDYDRDDFRRPPFGYDRDGFMRRGY